MLFFKGISLLVVLLFWVVVKNIVDVGGVYIPHVPHLHHGGREGANKTKTKTKKKKKKKTKKKNAYTF